MALYPTARVHPPLPSLNIPDTIDFHRKHNSTLPMYVFAATEQDGAMREVTYLEFGRAIHRVASAIVPILPPLQTCNTRPVIALMALTDSLLYQSIVIGIIKAGFIPFPISPRNTAAAVIYLMKKSSCHHVFTTQNTLKTLLDSIRSTLQSEEPDHELAIYEIPSLYNIFPKLAEEREEDPFTPFTAISQPALTDIAMYLHSSGSTGFPKAIPQTHQMFTHWAAFPCNDFFRNHKPDVRIAGMHLPPFHTLGLYCQVIFPVYATVTVGLYPPVVTSPDMQPVTPTPDNILSNIVKTNSNSIITIPALLQIWGQDAKSVDILSKLEIVAYSGGAVSPKLGDFMVSSGVKLSPNYGGTEFASVTHLAKRKGDENEWMYMEFSERCRLRWISQGDGTYECQFLTNENHKLPIENLPDVPGYATADLFEPHPTKDHLWKIVGRVDDVIIHSSGEKTVPSPMEDVVLSSNHLMGTVMFGRNHDQPGILVEPKPSFAIDVGDEKQVMQFRNLIWPVIEEANEISPSFSRIFKEMIIVTHKKKPLPRAGKGTVMRKLALQEYDAEIEALYSTVEATQPSESIQPPVTWTKEDVSHWLSGQVQDLNTGKSISPFNDLFEHGFDSLSATILRRRISGAIQTLEDSSRERALQAVTQNTIYNHPAIDLLAKYLSAIISGESVNGAKPFDRIERIEEMVSKYSFSEGLPNGSAPKTEEEARTPSVVLLTGSTGSIGSQLLEELIRDSRITRVYALNRSSKHSNPLSIYDRHLEKFKDKGLSITLLNADKVIFVESELSSPNLGLSEAIYKEILESVDTIIHTAWRLDFNLSLASFESNIVGMKNLVDFARSSLNVVRFIFTSSISSVASWNADAKTADSREVPESVIENFKYAVGNGYGESKYVAERILASSGLPYATSLRIGQVSGSLLNGAWSTTDWVPILVKSSIELGALPLANGVVSWTPLNIASRSILDVVFSSSHSTPVLNIRHPRPIEWNAVINHIADALQSDANGEGVETEGKRQRKRQKTSESDHRIAKEKLKFIPFHEWIDKLETYSKVNQDMDKVPAINLLDFFKRASEADQYLSTSTVREAGGLPTFSISRMVSISSSLREQPPLEYADVERWIAYWKIVGYIE